MPKLNRQLMRSLATILVRIRIHALFILLLFATQLVSAQRLARGVNAKPHQVVFPVPQSEIDANKAVVQTTGY
jgi:hypothetical protein